LFCLQAALPVSVGAGEAQGIDQPNLINPAARRFQQQRIRDNDGQ
jgi:hypothetical protein